DSILQWTGNTQNYYDYLKETWTSSVLAGGSWSQALHDGFLASDVEVTMEQVNAAAEGAGVIEEGTSNGALSF
ncbi:MAG TPA: hypothetical protein DC015_09600, partial [Aequorivita sp.]|nr:hypothetical protein [Aequorivita sp.]